MPFGVSQCTVGFPVQFQGAGVHSNEPVHMAVLPAPVNHGIVFECLFADHLRMPVAPDSVRSLGGCTEIVKGELAVKTIEHFLAACMAVGIDNALVKISAPELPVLDGSAWPFVLKLQEAKAQQNEGKPYYQLNHPIVVRHGNSYIEAKPSKALRINCEIDFDHPWFMQYEHAKKMKIVFNEHMAQDVIRARTFGFLKDLPSLLKQQLAQGASLKNSIVFDEYEMLNPEGLRFEKELVAHKILDLLGDLAVLGRPILADINAFCPSHRLNIDLVNQLVLGDQLVSLTHQADAKGQEKTEGAWAFE